MKTALALPIVTQIPALEIDWNPIGARKAPHTRLHADISIAGVWFHASAIQVNKFGQALCSDGRTVLARLNAIDPDVSFQTITIARRDYVFYLTPHGK